MKLFSIVMMATLSLQVTGIARAAGPADLGEALTPLGGERAGNAEGTVPAWTGDTGAMPGWSFGKPRGDFFKYKADKPLFEINAASLDKHAAHLTPGQQALLRTVKGYRMEVYPSRRTCAAPAAVAEATKKNALGAAALNDNGWSVKSALLPGVPFPLPKTGAEVMFNFKLRYRGIGSEINKAYTLLSPGSAAGDWIEASWTQTQYFGWAGKQAKDTKNLTPAELQQWFVYQTPAALAGQAMMASSYMNGRDTEVFYYFPGQRRVRRMPSYAYDAPQIGWENQYTVDQTMMFTGNLDRFDWNIVGKKSLLVPYNNFGLYGAKGTLRDVVQRDAISPELRRYEAHRVWVVEAKLKSGVRHSTPRRLFYVDEDSWIALVAEDYDAEGKLWKVRESYPIPVFETGTCDFYPFAQYDVLQSRYVADNITVGSDIKWLTESSDARFKDGYYTSDNLRAISER